MITVYHSEHGQAYAQALADALPGHHVAQAGPTPQPATRYAVVWNPPSGFFTGLTDLQAVFVLGAGVDRLLSHPDLPAHFPIYRLSDAGMAEQMVEYARYGVLHWQRSFDLYRHQQQERQWQVQPDRRKQETRVSVLGLGEMGGRVAMALAAEGYQVNGFSRKARNLPGVRCVHGGHALEQILAHTDVLINMLPLTPATRGLLDGACLARLPAGAALIHAGRGEQLDENALLAALDSGALRFALLDVFSLEPLAKTHRLWTHPRALITPHSAAQTLPSAAVRQISARIRALESGQAIAGKIERARAY